MKAAVNVNAYMTLCVQSIEPLKLRALHTDIFLIISTRMVKGKIVINLDIHTCISKKSFALFNKSLGLL